MKPMHDAQPFALHMLNSHDRGLVQGLQRPLQSSSEHLRLPKAHLIVLRLQADFCYLRVCELRSMPAADRDRDRDSGHSPM